MIKKTSLFFFIEGDNDGERVGLERWEE